METKHQKIFRDLDRNNLSNGVELGSGLEPTLLNKTGPL